MSFSRLPADRRLWHGRRADAAAEEGWGEDKILTSLMGVAYASGLSRNSSWAHPEAVVPVMKVSWRRRRSATDSTLAVAIADTPHQHFAATDRPRPASTQPHSSAAATAKLCRI